MNTTVYIPSYNRPQTITTHLLFSNYIIIVHNEEQRQMYIKNQTINPSRIVVSETLPGASINRQWALHNLIQKGEWYVMADDNITRINSVRSDWYTFRTLNVSDTEIKWREIYNTETDEARFFEIAEDTIREADSKNFHHCGFALTDNPFFNGVKFKYSGYVIGKLMVSRNLLTKTANELFGYVEGNVLEDMTATAENLLRWGGVVINSYLKPVSKHYMEGGIGTYEQRLPRKKVSCANLMKRYPGLFDFKEDDKSDVRIKLRTPKALNDWRKKMKIMMGDKYPYAGEDADSIVREFSNNPNTLF